MRKLVRGCRESVLEPVRLLCQVIEVNVLFRRAMGAAVGLVARHYYLAAKVDELQYGSCERGCAEWI
jgi:hypothetical protein